MAHTDNQTNLSYRKLTPKTCDSRVMKQMAKAFKDVFATEPWNEWKRCGREGCNAHWGINQQSELEEIKFLHCDQPVVDFWPESVVIGDLEHEITEEATCWIAAVEDQIVGFTWGYPFAIFELEAKIGIKLPRSVEGVDIPERFAYQDELGVVERFRGEKIARELFRLRLIDFIEQGLTYGVVRTRALPTPSVTYLWFTEKLGYIELARYPGDDGRVVLGAPLALVAERFNKP